MQRWQGRIASSTARIWPCLSPFMFREVMDVALSAPPPIRVRNRLTRRLIEHLDPQLSAIPLDDGTPAMPLRLSTAHHFWPLARKYAIKVIGKAFKRPAAAIAPNKIQPLAGRRASRHAETREPWRPPVSTTPRSSKPCSRHRSSSPFLAQPCSAAYSPSKWPRRP